MTGSARPVRLMIAILMSVAMLALLIRLGLWQLERARYKEQLAERAEQNIQAKPSQPHEIIARASDESWHFRPVHVVGRFDPKRQYLLDNRTQDGRAGYHVLSIFSYGDQHLLVNRGWVEVGNDRRVLPNLPLVEKQLSLTGQLVKLPGSGILLGDSGYTQQGWPKVVQRVELDGMTKQLGLALLPAVLLLEEKNPACLSCRWVSTQGISAARHRGYAMQWFSLAIALIILLGVASFFAARERG